MDCPVDGATLVMSERQGVEIDYCPTCRGVWLDRGELDKILERAAGDGGRDEPSPLARYRDERERDRPDYDRERERPRHEDDRPYKKKKRRSFLDDLFEFD